MSSKQKEYKSRNSRHRSRMNVAIWEIGAIDSICCHKTESSQRKSIYREEPELSIVTLQHPVVTKRRKDHQRKAKAAYFQSLPNLLLFLLSTAIILFLATTIALLNQKGEIFQDVTIILELPFLTSSLL